LNGHSTVHGPHFGHAIPSSINYFVYAAAPDALPVEMVIDFSAVHSFQSSTSLLNQLKQQKRLQLLPTVASVFKSG
jgi:hypothetical protein